MPVTFPGESPAYRTARDALLTEEIALRAQVERVAALRRDLPLGGSVADYAFQELSGETLALGELFSHPNRTLAIYSLMFRPDQNAPCPMCTSMLDGLAGQAQHIAQHMDFVVVAAAKPEQLRALSDDRGWGALRLLSTDGSTYQTDYGAEAPDGSQLPMMNVFSQTENGVRHFWGSEMFHAGLDGHPRHVDQLWPLWNMLDLTPAGRPDWFPALDYNN
ncbi:MAG: DUF899 family protein [Paracoccaceae bacterium]